MREVDENEIQSFDGNRCDTGARDDSVCADYDAATGANRNDPGTERHDNDRGDDNGPAMVSAAAGRVAVEQVGWLESQE
jgi:hypothetical protein